ncbi:hypothetical protein BMW23_0207 [Bodo saltans virus]|uniref:Microbial-type PARG catalytic domain-containing protein n=1 Tax=Bodo saltans virus TaxID=2024608 RepID=A0A2H4UTX0_9VIRU|nr:hypothetical protein QJ851_gp0202 [Bodo saltans virus]ATZ80265.1 hypothetical protein BMW23_0207 [Bodo saltans virus]
MENTAQMQVPVEYSELVNQENANHTSVHDIASHDTVEQTSNDDKHQHQHQHQHQQIQQIHKLMQLCQQRQEEQQRQEQQRQEQQRQAQHQRFGHDNTHDARSRHIGHHGHNGHNGHHGHHGYHGHDNTHGVRPRHFGHNNTNDTQQSYNGHKHQFHNNTNNNLYRYVLNNSNSTDFREFEEFWNFNSNSMPMKTKSRRELVVEENEAMLVDPKYKFNVSKPKTIYVSQTYKMNIVPGTKNTQVKIIASTTNEAIHKYHSQDPNFRIFAMNFANAQCAGGGYANGAMAQEEELCRTIIDLFPSLLTEANPKTTVYNEGVFKWFETVKLSENLSLYRLDKAQSNGEYDMMKEPIKVNIVTAAAPNIIGENDRKTNILLNETSMFADVVAKLIKTCLLTPYVTSNGSIKQEKTVFIAGAFGCGVFAPSKNIQDLLFKKIGMRYTELIAYIFKHVLTSSNEIMTLYDEICFAIPPGENYDAFYKILCEN